MCTKEWKMYYRSIAGNHSRKVFITKMKSKCTLFTFYVPLWSWLVSHVILKKNYWAWSFWSKSTLLWLTLPVPLIFNPSPHQLLFTNSKFKVTAVKFLSYFLGIFQGWIAVKWCHSHLAYQRWISAWFQPETYTLACFTLSLYRRLIHLVLQLEKEIF